MSVNAREVDQSYRWDITLTITEVRVLDRQPTWADESVRVDPYVMDELRMTVDLEPTPQVLPIEFGAFYTDLGGSPNGPDVGDMIIFAGLSRMHQGSDMQINGADFGLSLDIPTWYEQPYDLILSEPDYEVLDPEEKIWSAFVTIDSVEPERERIPWEWLWTRCSRWGVEGLLVEEEYPGSQRVDPGLMQAYHQDVGAPNGLVDPGDRIWVAGIGVNRGDSYFRVYTGDRTLDRFHIQDLLPCVNGTCVLSLPSLETRTIEGTLYSDLEWRVTEVALAGEDGIPWKKSRLTVERQYGLSDLTFNALNDNNHYGTSPQGWVNDRDRDGNVSVGDIVHLTGQNHLSEVFPGGWITIHRESMAVGIGDIPDILPGLDRTLYLDYADPTLEGPRFSVTYKIKGLTPDDVEVPWSSVNFSIHDGETSEVIETRRPLSEGEASSSSSPKGWYTDREADGHISQGENITITGLSKRHLGTKLHVDSIGMGLATAWIPLTIEVTDIKDFSVGIETTELEQVPVDDTPMWRFSMYVCNLSDEDLVITWDEVTIELVTWNGTVIVDDMGLDAFPPSDGIGWDGFNTDDLKAWHLDVSPGDGKVGRGDLIAITGIGEDLGAVRIFVNVDGKVTYGTVLPGSLPS